MGFDQSFLYNFWTQGNLEAVIFYCLAAAAIVFAVGVINNHVIIRSGFLLIGVFGAISGLFLLLQAQFIALAQIMIYAVGITLVVVIALMLTNPKLEKDHSPIGTHQRLSGLFVAVLIFGTIYLAMRSESFPISDQSPLPDYVMTIGHALVTDYSLPFEFASLLLLAALMGSILLAKSDVVKRPPTRVAASDDDSADNGASERGVSLSGSAR